MLTFMPIPKLVSEWTAWAAFAAQTGPKASNNPHSEAFDEFLWIVEQHPERAWNAIEAVLVTPEAMPSLGHLAAGPLEDLLSHHGHQFIDRVEALAKCNPEFALALDGVWRFTMAEDVWVRVQAAKRTSASSSDAPRGDT